MPATGTRARCARPITHTPTLSLTANSQEVADELDKTLKGIAANAEQLRSFGIGSEHVAVVIIVDGYSNMHPSVAEYMEKTLNVYVPRMVLPTHNGRNVTCHWFERKVAITKHRTENLFYEPLQICFVIKSRNGGKLNSHLWFYRCFCELIHPSHTFVSHSCPPQLPPPQPLPRH